MRVALLHNRYQQAGGEDQVFAAEGTLLEQRRHALTRFVLDNKDIEGMSRASLAYSMFWNRSVAASLRRSLGEAEIDVAHFHNTFPLMSPSAYQAARDCRAAVVQTLHNFRLLCPSATFFRNGRVCEDCSGKRVAWPGVLHACYRKSRVATAAAAAVVSVHRAVGTWSSLVDVYIALTEFARQKFIEGGLPAEQIVVRPNFLSADPGVGPHDGGYALYVGRLSAEKGINTLLEAWKSLKTRCQLRVVGSGPLSGLLGGAPASVEYTPWVDRDGIFALMRGAAVLVVPSSCYEQFPMTIVEAFATGLPVIASGHGSLAEIVHAGETGWHSRPGDSIELAQNIEAALSDEASRRRMGAEARRTFERRYSAEAAYTRLMEIYAIAHSRSRLYH